MLWNIMEHLRQGERVETSPCVREQFSAADVEEKTNIAEADDGADDANDESVSDA